MGQGPCTPNATRMTACGACGTETDRCSASCQWVAGQCQNQGVCAPGDVMSCNDGCSGVMTCSGSCDWGPCCSSCFGCP
jgi:hypothetical protein